MGMSFAFFKLNLVSCVSNSIQNIFHHDVWLNNGLLSLCSCEILKLYIFAFSLYTNLI